MINVNFPPLPDPPEYPPCRRKCGFCFEDVPDADYMFSYDGVLICEDCLWNEVKNMTAVELAEALQIHYEKEN